VRPDLGQHYLCRAQRHREQMFERAMFALTDNGRSGQEQREHRDTVDDLHDADKPCKGEVRIEFSPDQKVELWSGRFLGVISSIEDLMSQNLLYVKRPPTGYRHCRCVHVDLDGRLAAMLKIAFNVGWNINNEGVSASVHRVVDSLDRYLSGPDKQGRHKCLHDVLRQHGTVLIDDRDRGMINVHVDVFSGTIDEVSQRKNDQKDKCRIAL